MKNHNVCALAVLGSLCAASVATAQTTQEILSPAAGKVIYVSTKGKKKNDGSAPDKPMKGIDKAIEAAAEGDTIAVAEGTYKAGFGAGFWELDKGVKLYGGFSEDFSERNWVTHKTLLQPGEDRFEKSGGKDMLFRGDNKYINGLVVDGFIFEAGAMTPYEPEKGKPEGVETGMMKIGPGSRNPVPKGINVSGNDITIRNNVFVNLGGGGVNVVIQGNRGAQLKDTGKCEIANNVFVACRMYSISVNGGDREPITTPVNIHHNTILFTWSRLKDMGDNGYGIDIGTKIPYLIENNIMALNIGPGMSSQRFNEDIEFNNNLFWGNKKKDLWFCPSGGTNIKIECDEFEDLDFDNEGNSNEPIALPLNKAYTEGVLAASYSEKTDYDENSEANRLRELFGLNKQGKIDSTASMFANRYPWEETLALFGAVPDKGAQAPQ